MKRAVAKRGVGVLVAGLLSVGCGHDKDGVKKDADAPGTQRLSENIRQQKRGDEKVTEYDLNHDNKPDVWDYTVTVKGPDGKDVERLTRKELDVNWDGKVDIAKFYDAKEQVEREMLDLDFDGRVDQVNFYEKGVIVRKERDLDYNGKTDLWTFYEKGKLVRKEKDVNGDGKVDYWEYWEGDHVDRIGEDLDGDGNVDRWTKNPNSEP